jgi:hypothetical protein
MVQVVSAVWAGAGSSVVVEVEPYGFGEEDDEDFVQPVITKTRIE